MVTVTTKPDGSHTYNVKAPATIGPYNVWRLLRGLPRRETLQYLLSKATATVNAS